MTSRTRRWDLDLAGLAALAGLVALRFAPWWAAGRTPFWGDLTYIHHPWRAFDAQLLAAGRLPLWNPYLYFGMPQAAAMQDSLFYPGTAPFFLFGFATAAAVFQAFHYWLAAALAYLWVRSVGLRRTSAFGAAALLSLGGVFLGKLPFLNHLAVLSLAPAMLLFFRKPSLLALVLAMAFFAGYPPFLIGSAVSAWAVAAALSPRAGGARFWAGAAAAWAKAAGMAAALAAVLLLPAVELFKASRRASGVGRDEALTLGFSAGDLAGWISPWLAGPFDPSARWWTSCYLGFLGCALAAAGLAAVPARRRVLLAAALAAALALILGGAHPWSRWLWEHAPPLRFIRYPGNLAFFALLPVAAAAAAGLEASRRRVWLAAALCAELSVCAWGAIPTAPRGLFTSPGPLVRRLQAQLDGHRYLLSPLALETHGGAGVEDWRHRLYGLTNAPFRLRAAGNFGEPLVPRRNYELMEALYRAPGAVAASALFPWADIAVLLTPRPAAGPGLVHEGREIWEIQRYARPAGAWRLSAQAGAALPESAQAPLPSPREPLTLARRREDAFSVVVAQGAAGWAFLSEPLFPGWEAWLETPLGAGRTRALPAVGPFQKVQVPRGAWALHLRYDPSSFRWGALLTAAAAGMLAAYWYNRARKTHEP